MLFIPFLGYGEILIHFGKNSALKNIDKRRISMRTSEYDTFLNPYFLILIAINSLTSLAFNMTTPLLPRYAIELGTNATLAGTLSSMISITALFGRPFCGALADRAKYKTMILVGIILMGIGTFGIGLFTSIPQLIAFRILQGIGFCLNSTVILAATVGYMPKNRIGEGIGYMGVINIISINIAPSFALFLSRQFSYQVAFRLIALIFLLACLPLIFIKFDRDTTAVQKFHLKAIHIQDLFAVELLPLAVFSGCFSFCNSIISNFLTISCDHKGITGYGSYFLVNAVALLFVRLFLGKLIDHNPLKNILIPAYLLTAIGMACIGLADGINLILLAAVLKGLGQGTGQPAIQAECLKRMGLEKRGLATSMYYLGADFFQGIGPVTGGVLIDWTGSYSTLYLFGAVLCLVALIIYTNWNSHQNKTETSVA